MSNFLVQIIRSVVPIVVGWVVGLLAAASINVSPEDQATLVVSASTLAASLYYIGVAWLERTYPVFGWLLGVARNPVYAAKDEQIVTVPAGAAVSVELTGTPLTASELLEAERFEAEGGVIPTLHEGGTDSEGARY